MVQLVPQPKLLRMVSGSWDVRLLAFQLALLSFSVDPVVNKMLWNRSQALKL